MSEPQFPLRLNNYFFTQQDVVANPEHKQAKAHELNMHFDVSTVVSKISEGNSFSLEVTISTDTKISIRCIQVF